jgi:hypothetical protein
VKNVARGLLILLLALLVACPQTPPINPQFNIEIVYLDNFPTQYKPVMVDIVQYWEKIIVGDISDFNSIANPMDCSFTREQSIVPQAIRTHVDDLILYVGMNKDITAIDGIIADGGPCLTRNAGSINLPLMSKLFFNKAYFDDYSTNKPNLLKDAAIHEVGHALGFGTIWQLFPGLNTQTAVGSACGNNPEFTGINAKREYQALGGTGNVPLKATSENGTCGHWSEKLFDREIMTPAPNETPANTGQTNPLSRLTIASMEDLGYTVDYGLADSYALSVAEINSTFNIEWYYSNDFPNSLKPSFEAAAARWQSIITSDIPNMNGGLKPAASGCNIKDEAPFPGVDDIAIYVGIIPAAQSAGPNGLKFRAEPCVTRAGSFLPAISVIQFSSDTLPTAYQNPESFFNPTTIIFTHNIARALGFGTNWLKKGLISGSVGNGLCSSDSEYTGGNAVREAQLLGEVGNIIFRWQVYNIPNDPPAKCSESWNNSRYAYEMMGGANIRRNGWLSTPPALSKVSIGAMQDLGYTVDYGAADPIELPVQWPTDPCPPPGCV